MVKIVVLNWWALALRGIVAIAFGVIAFFMPVVTLFTLTLLFGTYALVDGVLSLAAVVRAGRKDEQWWEFVFKGILGLGAAAATMIWPEVSLALLVYAIAGWAVVTGVIEIVAAMRLRRYIAGEWLLALAGVTSVVFGFLLFGAPGPGAVVLAWWIGIYVL